MSLCGHQALDVIIGSSKSLSQMANGEDESTSYNSEVTGCSDDKLKYLNDQSLKCDIILVQEHWLLSNNLKRNKNGVVNFTGIANSGVDDTQCNGYGS